MTIGDWINVVLCILSFILALISVATVVITLRQNHKIIEESNRPYISIYGDETNFSSPQFYIVLKNFGKTGAIIKSLECDVDLSKYSYRTGILCLGFLLISLVHLPFIVKERKTAKIDNQE